MKTSPAKRKAAAIAEKFLNTCGWCVHWNLRQDGKGDCRRHPPQVLGADEDGSVWTVWPVTAREEAACGEFKPRISA